jgi:hypothetical protein
MTAEKKGVGAEEELEREIVAFGDGRESFQ